MQRLLSLAPPPALVSPSLFLAALDKKSAGEQYLEKSSPFQNGVKINTFNENIHPDKGLESLLATSQFHRSW